MSWPARIPRSCGRWPGLAEHRLGVARAGRAGRAEQWRHDRDHVDDLAVDVTRSAARDRESAAAQRAPAARLFRLGPGQLAAEMARGAWLHTSADPKLVFETPPDLMWDAAMRSLGINPGDLFVGRGVN